MNLRAHLLTWCRLRTAVLGEGQLQEVQRCIAAAAGGGPPDAPVPAPEEAPRPVPAVVLVIRGSGGGGEDWTRGRASVVMLWQCRVTPEGRRRQKIKCDTRI